MFDISSIIREVSIALVPFLFAVTVHEAAHGYAAYFLGDNTAKLAGRLTLNPLKHIDIVGLLVLLITRLIGWAKPVPVNYWVVSRKPHGMAIVAAAGPFANLLTAFVSATVLKFLLVTPMPNETVLSIMTPVALMLDYSVRINVALMVFNLFPLPPLDGGRIVQDFLPPDMAAQFGSLERYGMLILILLMITGVVGKVISPIIFYVTRILM